MVSDDKPQERKRHGHHGFIPAGILIGLGVGLLVNFPAAGVLIGLGCGFIASTLLPHEVPGPSAAGPGGCCGPAGRSWGMILTGFFMILIGLGLVLQPALIWPYLIAVILILLGIGFAVRGLRRG